MNQLSFVLTAVFLTFVNPAQARKIYVPMFHADADGNQSLVLQGSCESQKSFYTTESFGQAIPKSGVPARAFFSTAKCEGKTKAEGAGEECWCTCDKGTTPVDLHAEKIADVSFLVCLKLEKLTTD